MQVACLRCLPARKPLRRFSTLRRFPPFLPCRTPVRSISDTHPVDIGHRSGPNRTPFRSHRKTVRHQSGRLSDFNRNTVRFESERCPTSNRIGVRFASEYAFEDLHRIARADPGQIIARTERKIVQHDHLMPPTNQGLRQMRSDEPGTAGDQCFHWATPNRLPKIGSRTEPSEQPEVAG